MRGGFGWHHIWALVVVAFLIFGHLAFTWQLTPLVPLLLSLPLFFAFTYKQSLPVFALLVLLLEVFSSFTPGVATLVVVIPYFAGRWMPDELRLWSGQLWLGLLVIVAVQLCVLLLLFWWQLHDMAIPFLKAVPWIRVASEWLITSGLVAISIGAWHELRP